ncbi:hypothetical protein BC427_06220 [Ralstonia solanacearum FJAT-91]|nr:hypothetical protein BC427_06220 [Ralstonia solanacearum FJAT-91]
MQHDVMLIMTNAIFHDGIFGGESGYVLVIRNSVERDTVPAGAINHRAVSNDQAFREELI